MKKNKIKNVYYSNNDGNIVREKVDSMEIHNAHVTSGIKKYMNKNNK